MSYIRGEIVINRSVEQVFDFVADDRNEPRYNPVMKSVELMTRDPIGVGTQFRLIAGSRGQPVEMITTLVAYERPRHIALETHMSAMDIHGSLNFDSVPEGTRMRWSWEIVPRGVYRLMGPVLAQLGARQEARIWAAMAQYLEQAEQPTCDDVWTATSPT